MGQLKIGIIIASRRTSKRIREKPFQIINHVSLLQHLVQRLHLANLPIIIAVPQNEVEHYKFHFSKSPSVVIFGGSASDPLERMATAAKIYRFDAVVRVCHDKIFVDHKQISRAIDEFERGRFDYLFSSSNVDGAGFEICSTSALSAASAKFRNVEHISYAVRAVVAENKMFNYPFKCHGPRLLIDYPEDLKLVRHVIGQLGNDATLDDVLKYWHDNPSIFEVNRLPLVTVYTCVFNGMPLIKECIASVIRQSIFHECEYLIIDDGSTDDTFKYCQRTSDVFDNVKVIRNQENLGLASSSNVALDQSKGKYIIRLDHDDYFCRRSVLHELVAAMFDTGVECLYPANYFGSTDVIQPGGEAYHVGGSLFEKKAINHIKFTDGLRFREGWDFFERAKDVLKIGTYDKPTFFYRQRPGSLSRVRSRKKIKVEQALSQGLTGESLCNL